MYVCLLEVYFRSNMRQWGTQAAALAWREISDASVAEYNDYNFSHLGLFRLDVLVIFLLYLHNFVVLAYIGTDNQFIPKKNDEFNSDDENVVQI